MMLFRIMMVVFLLVVSAVPAWAGEKASVPIESSYAPAAEQMTMEEALSKVTIKAEDWLDGDTYHIRYTFINPTDVYIEKEVACVITRYDLQYPSQDSTSSARQYNDEVSPPYYSTACNLYYCDFHKAVSRSNI